MDVKKPPVGGERLTMKLELEINEDQDGSFTARLRGPVDDGREVLGTSPGNATPKAAVEQVIRLFSLEVPHFGFGPVVRYRLPPV